MKNKFFKALSVIVVLSFIAALFVPVNVETKAAENTLEDLITENETIMMPVYVGQTNTLSLAIAGSGVAKPSQVKWKVTGGDGKVKINNKKTTYKGVKAGTVYITATYKKKSYDFVLEVRKKKSLKARTVEVDNINFNIPANYEVYMSPLYINTKKEAGFFLQGMDFGFDVSNFDDSLWELYEESLFDGLENMDLSSYDVYGVGFDDSQIEKNIEKIERGVYVFTFKCKVKNIGTYYYKTATILSGTSQKFAAFYSLNEDDIADDFEYFIKHNK